MQAQPGRPRNPQETLQLCMFDLQVTAKDGGDTQPARDAVVEEQVATKRTKPSTRLRDPMVPVCVIAIESLPDYPREAIAQVDRLIAALPPEKLWFTYHDIKNCFGVSRATVARRMKEGAVPNVRFQQGRMLEDGAVRRLDREQLRWLLLAVQSGPLRARHGLATVPKR